MRHSPDATTRVAVEPRNDHRSTLVSATRVNVENFVRAESDRMFASFVVEAGGVNLFNHRREPRRSRTSR